MIYLFFLKNHIVCIELRIIMQGSIIFQATKKNCFPCKYFWIAWLSPQKLMSYAIPICIILAFIVSSVINSMVTPLLHLNCVYSSFCLCTRIYHPDPTNFSISEQRTKSHFYSWRFTLLWVVIMSVINIRNFDLCVWCCAYNLPFGRVSRTIW